MPLGILIYMFTSVIYSVLKQRFNVYTLRIFFIGRKISHCDNETIMRKTSIVPSNILFLFFQYFV